MEYDDKIITELYFARSEEAISATREKYGGYCSAIASAILGNAQDAEECVSDMYLRTWNSIPPARPVSLRPYLGKIIRNLALDRYERDRADKRSIEMTQLYGELADILPDITESQSGEGEISAAISAFLRTQPPLPRMLFVRRYWYADSIERLSELTGMSKSKLTSILFRQRKKLRGYLERKGIYI